VVSLTAVTAAGFSTSGFEMPSRPYRPAAFDQVCLVAGDNDVSMLCARACPHTKRAAAKTSKKREGMAKMGCSVKFLVTFYSALPSHPPIMRLESCNGYISMTTPNPLY